MINENLFSETLDDIPALIRRLEPDFTISFANKAYLDFLNLPKESVTGERIDSVLGQTGKTLIRSLKSLSRGNPLKTTTQYTQNPSGYKIWIEWRERALFDEHGQIRGYQSIGIDVTNQTALDNLLTLQRDLALSMDTKLSLQEAFTLIGQTVTRIDTIDYCTLYIRNKKTENLDLVFQTGLKESFTKKIICMPKDSYQHTILISGKPFYKPYKETQFAQIPGNDNPDIRAFGAVPLQQNGRVIASFMIGSATVEDFPDIVRSTIQALAAQVGNVLIEKEIENELKQISERFELAILGGNLGTWDWDIPRGNVVFNDRSVEMLGYKHEDLEEDIRAREKLIHPDDVERVTKAINRHLRGESQLYQTEYRLKTKDGAWKWILDTGKVFTRDKNRNPLRAVGTHLDITPLKEQENKLKKLSIRDFLTGTYTRMHILERLEEKIANHKRTGLNVTLALLEIDNYKNVNDIYGHLCGDHILKEFAGILNTQTRPYDLIGRFMGETFIIIFSEADITSASSAMERIRVFVEKTKFLYKKNPIKATFSCGIVDFKEIKQEEFGSDILLERANDYLYQAKKTGGNRIFTLE